MNDTHLKYDIEIKCCSDDSSDKILTVDTLVDIIFVNVDIDNTNEEWVNNFKLGETCLINVYINKLIKLREYIKKNNIIINTLTIYNKKIIQQILMMNFIILTLDIKHFIIVIYKI
jgi:hypothetical protein